MNYNPNFVAYANYRGLTPEKCLELDEKEYTGGKMTGFILWFSNEKTLFEKEQGRKFVAGEFFYTDSKKLSEWLQTKYFN